MGLQKWFDLASSILMSLFLLSAFCCVFLAGACFEYRRQKAVRIYTAIMLLYVGWSLANLLVILSSDLEVKEFFARLRFIFISPLPPLWIYFSRELFKKPGQDLHNPYLKGLFIVPVFIWIAALSSSLKHFIIQSYEPFEVFGISTIRWIIGPLGQLHIAYSYILLGFVFYICIAGVRSQEDRKPLYAMLTMAGLFIYILPELSGFLFFPEVRFLGLPLLGQVFSSIIFYYILHRQAAVRSFSQNNDLLFEALPTPAVLFSRDEKLILYNSRAQNLFQLNLASVGQTFKNAMPSYITDNMELHSSGAIIEKKDSSSAKYYKVICEPVRNTFLDGEGVLIIFKDVSELKRFTQINQRLLSLISHDLLGNLSSLSHLIVKRDEKYWDVLAESVRSSVDLVKNILLWSSNQGGLYQISKEPIQVMELLCQAVEQLRPVLHEKNISVQGSALRNETVVCVDVKMFLAIVRNTLSNAIKYSPKGSSVDIEFERIEQNYHLRIIDRGPGIENSRVHSILNQSEFRPLNKELKSDGYGIGLFLSLQFLRLHKGHLEISSVQDGWGCKVTAIFPVC